MITWGIKKSPKYALLAEFEVKHNWGNDVLLYSYLTKTEKAFQNYNYMVENTIKMSKNFRHNRTHKLRLSY